LPPAPIPISHPSYQPPPPVPYMPGPAAAAQAPAAGPLIQPFFAPPPLAGWRLVGADRVGTPIDIRLDGALLEQPEGVVFGRLPRYCHLTIDNDSISRRHARFRAAAGTLTVEDLGSTNGTAVDGYKIEPYRPVPVRDGSRISLGEIKVVISRS
ncbi:MAG TPA: FHA domain-containing protein, partial [Vineibacter sp.]|nr:FHA domain-containing protein [Vineibacter sp.]